MEDARQRWSIRARSTGAREVSVYARNHVFKAGTATSLHEKDDAPSGLELLLGAFAAELIHSLRGQASRRRLTVHEAEVSLAAELHNPLVQLGVVGERGDAGLRVVTGTVYVSADGDESALDEAWAETLARSLFHQTLRKSAAVSLRLEKSP
jgi:uncharacterized OsmC-like protein